MIELTFIKISLLYIFIYFGALIEGLFKFELSLKLSSRLPLKLELLIFIVSGLFITALKIL